MRDIWVTAAVTAFGSLLGCQAATPKMCDGRPPIERAQIEVMFDQMRADTSWDLNGPMLWGYFFTDAKRGDLKNLSKQLLSEGYRFVGIHPNGDWGLHVERIESHTPETLHNRNLALYALAAEYSVDCYDGMDVGPAPKR